jgi:hypothetical protein
MTCLRPQICIQSLALIVIALKRNGVYAEHHPSAATWIEASCLKVERIVALKCRSNSARRS